MGGARDWGGARRGKAGLGEQRLGPRRGGAGLHARGRGLGGANRRRLLTRAGRAQSRAAEEGLARGSRGAERRSPDFAVKNRRSRAGRAMAARGTGARAFRLLLLAQLVAGRSGAGGGEPERSGPGRAAGPGAGSRGRGQWAAGISPSLLGAGARFQLIPRESFPCGVRAAPVVVLARTDATFSQENAGVPRCSRSRAPGSSV